MKKYKNLSGNSGVTFYKIEPSQLTVSFKDGETYIYSSLKPGLFHLEKMKALAIQGSGLGTYISKFVKKNYFKKL